MILACQHKWSLPTNGNKCDLPRLLLPMDAPKSNLTLMDTLIIAASIARVRIKDQNLLALVRASGTTSSSCGVQSIGLIFLTMSSDVNVDVILAISSSLAEALSRDF